MQLYLDKSLFSARQRRRPMSSIPMTSH